MIERTIGTETMRIVKKVLIVSIFFGAGFGMGSMLTIAAGAFDEIPIVTPPPVLYQPPPICPPYIPHTPLTPEELVGLERARDTNSYNVAQIELSLRQEIADLKRELGR